MKTLSADTRSGVSLSPCDAMFIIYWVSLLSIRDQCCLSQLVTSNSRSQCQHLSSLQQQPRKQLRSNISSRNISLQLQHLRLRTIIMEDIIPSSQLVIGNGAFSVVYRAKLKKVS